MIKEREVSWGDIYSAILKLDRKIERISPSGKRFISRTQIINEIGENNYRYGVDNGYLTEYKGCSRNSKILIERVEYEHFIDLMKR